MKKSIEQLKARKRVCLLRARRNLAEAIAIDETIEKMRSGKIKAPVPAGKKVLFEWKVEPAGPNDSIDDLRPVAPGSCGPC